ncbi:MAG TPA: hypothetical protein VK416_02830 [Thermoanaerobaculia bacterium]|nr:hypothetical protein [Thermoanaerobaculia bacterium]
MKRDAIRWTAFFAAVKLLLHFWNEESERPEIFVCRGLREPWPEFWRRLRSFG